MLPSNLLCPPQQRSVAGQLGLFTNTHMCVRAHVALVLSGIFLSVNSRLVFQTQRQRMLPGLPETRYWLMSKLFSYFPSTSLHNRFSVCSLYSPMKHCHRHLIFDVSGSPIPEKTNYTLVLALHFKEGTMTGTV